MLPLPEMMVTDVPDMVPVVASMVPLPAAVMLVVPADRPPLTVTEPLPVVVRSKILPLPADELDTFTVALLLLM